MCNFVFALIYEVTRKHIAIRVKSNQIKKTTVWQQ
jgi:hypothetical protein